MTSARHARASELFLGAVALPAAERSAFLRRECGADVALCREVEELLACDARPAEVDKAIAVSPMRLAAQAELKHTEPIPDRIGGYRILGLLGRGGMGTVYRAQQTRPDRVVALKVMSHSSLSPSMRRRFEFETRVLARLRHPGIAQIYESGVAEDADRRVPYFAMELVEGLPLTQFARAHDLSARDRIALLLKVCAAVQHAHQNGVIHRDLKPGNILVFEEGGSTQASDAAGSRAGSASAVRTSQSAHPKVLDFGVARALDPEMCTTTLATAAGQIVGTLAYMSPEQVAGDTAAVDTRSDIYSLGVTAFELLTGRLPCDLRDKPFPQAVRIIQEQAPLKLSAVNRSLRGDLDTIIAKTLEKERERRYASVSDFAADLERYLRDEPISARPPSRVYQLRKFARRNRLFVGAVAAAFALLVIAVAGTGYGLIQARRGQALAEKRLEEREAVSRFMLRILTTPRPDTERRDITVVEALEVAQKEVDTAFADKPEIRAAVHSELGGTYFELGRPDDGVRHLRRAHELFQQLFGDGHANTVKAANDLGVALTQSGAPQDLDEARDLLKVALRQTRLLNGHRSLPAAQALNQLANVYWYQQDTDRAEALTREALDICLENRAAQDPIALASRVNIAMLVGLRGDYAGQENQFREVLEHQERDPGPDHPATISTRRNLANSLAALSRVEEAEAILVTNIAASRRVMGDHHPTTLLNLHDRARCLFRMGQLHESEELLTSVLAREEQALGQAHALTCASRSVLTDVLVFASRFADAEPHFALLAADAEEKYGEQSSRALKYRAWLSICAAEQGRLDDARTMLNAIERTEPGDDADANFGHMLSIAQARFLWFDGRFDEAQDKLLSVARKLAPGEFDVHAHVARRHLAQLYQAWNKPELAARWKTATVFETPEPGA